MYLDLLKTPKPDDKNPEELTFEFKFREICKQSQELEELWYPIGRILDFNDAEDSNIDMKEELGIF